MSAKQQGLRLNLPGAPSTPHQVVGIQGLFRTTRATPVGGAGEPTEEHAKAAHADPGCPLELVTLSDKDLAACREQHQADLDEARNGIRQARATAPDGAELEQLKDEQAAVSGREA